MNRLLRWLVLPAVLFGSLLVFSASQAEAGRLWARTFYPAYCGYSYTYSPCATASCGWTPMYLGSPAVQCATYRTMYVAPIVPTCTSCAPVCTSGCASGCSSCGF